MILELALQPIFLILKGVIALIPIAFTIPNWTLSTISLLSKGLAFFPLDLWIVIIGNVTFWLSAQFIWAIVEWVYKKIPGVD